MRLRDGRQLPAAALAFDMDGTLLTSNPAVEWVWRTWATERGIPPEDVLAIAHGRRGIDIVKLFAPSIDPVEKVARIVTVAMEMTEGVAAVVGAQRLLQSLPPGQWAIVTSSPKGLVLAYMRHVDLPVPAVMITAEDVIEGKPDPAGYLAAAERMGCRPVDLVVFEDAPAGFEAAERSSAALVAVATTQRADELGSCHWIPDLEGVRYDGHTLTFG